MSLSVDSDHSELGDISVDKLALTVSSLYSACSASLLSFIFVARDSHFSCQRMQPYSRYRSCSVVLLQIW